MKIYIPSNKPMNVVVFGSGSGSNLEALLKVQNYITDIEKPLYEIKAIVCDRDCNCLAIASRQKIPSIYLDFKSFFKNRGKSFNDKTTREEYDSQIVHLLNDLAIRKNFSIDIIALAGYMRIIHKPLIAAFADKIINVHPADLSKTAPDGKRLYAGNKAIQLAISSGGTKTYSCVHIVNEEVDSGDILVTSKGLEVDPLLLSKFGIEKYSEYHQQNQKRYCDWPAYAAAVTLIAQGRVQITTGVYVDGNRTTTRGFDLEERIDDNDLAVKVAGLF